jgi:hypothetical protein
MDQFMGDPLTQIGLGILAAPGYGGNWMRAAATGMQQGMLAHQQRQKFEEEMTAAKDKRVARDEMKRYAERLPEPYRTLAKLDPDSFGQVIAASMKPKEDPAAIRELQALQAMGIPRDEAMRMVFEKGKTTVNVGGQGQAGPVPSGHVRVPDPGSPTGTRVVPEPGGEEFTKRQQAAAQAESAVANVQKMLDLIRSHGTEAAGPLSDAQASGTMSLLYGQILSSIAQLREMGVLQPGEVALLQSQISNPSDPRSYTVGNDRMIAQYTELARQLEQRAMRLQSTVPGAMPQGQSQPAAGDLRGPALDQRIEELERRARGAQ